MKAHCVAQFFLAFANECGDLVSNLKLNKLLYYAQAWHLAAFHEPLFEDEIEAWVHGPVVPSVYEEYKAYQYRPILQDGLDLAALKQFFNSSQLDILNDVVELYLPCTGYELEQMTHDEDPWRCARVGLPPDMPSHNVITHEAMQAYYGARIKQEV